MDPVLIGLLVGGYVVLALTYSWGLLPWLERRMESGAIDGFMVLLVNGWLRLLHRPTWLGFEPAADALRGGAILISNHGSGLDPFLLQAPLRRRIRWMMARDQMYQGFDEVWRHLEVLPVTYGPADTGTLREALRHVQAGGLLGIFPEAGIARPPHELRPFLPGASLIVARAKVPVVVCWIEGAPYTENAFLSLLKPSQSRVHCLGVVDFEGERDTAVITARLRDLIQRRSGWPLNDAPLPGTTPASGPRVQRVR